MKSTVKVDKYSIYSAVTKYTVHVLQFPSMHQGLQPHNDNEDANC